MTLLGFPLGVGSASNGLRDVNDAPVSVSQFFDLVSPASTNAAGVAVPGTLVKVIFDDLASTVREAEIED